MPRLPWRTNQRVLWKSCEIPVFGISGTCRRFEEMAFLPEKPLTANTGDNGDTSIEERTLKETAVDRLPEWKRPNPLG